MPARTASTSRAPTARRSSTSRPPSTARRCARPRPSCASCWPCGGLLVEDNDYAVSVHYRNVADGDCAALDAAVDAALEAFPTLARFPGKKVVELRPDLEWNKGKAVEFILEKLEAELGGPVFPIYLGDDVSDEDAFKVLRSRGGLGILINEGMVSREQTAATYKLRSPKEVLRLLRKLPAE